MLPSAVPYCSDLRTISRIDFSLLSSDEVRRSAIVTVTSSRLVQPVHIGTSAGGSNQIATTGLHGTLYDPRFGTIERMSKCATCSLSETECPGHRGVILLDEPIFYPPTIANNEVLKVLRTLCFVCRNTLIDEDWIKLYGLDQQHGLKRWNSISVMLKENPIRCRRCQTPQLDFRVEEYRVFAYAQEKRFRVTVPRKARAKPATAIDAPAVADVVQETGSFKQEVSARQLLELMGVMTGCDHSTDMDTLRAEAWQQLTGSPESPLNMVMTTVGVLELRNRPYIVMNNGLTHDDLTFKYSEIIKTNEKIRKLLGKGPAKKGSTTPSTTTTTEEPIPLNHAIRDLLRDYTAQLSCQVRTTFHNKGRQSKNPHTQTPTKDFQKRLDTKAGRIRGNLSGKRVNFCTRAPISPDASLDADVVRMSPAIARVLTFPMHVTSANMARAMSLMQAGKVNAVIRRNTQPLTDVQQRNPLPLHPKWFDVQAVRRARFTQVLDKTFELQLGDIIHTSTGPKQLATEADIASHHLSPGERVVRDKRVVYPVELTAPREEKELWSRSAPNTSFVSRHLGCLVHREPPRDFPLKVGDIIERQYETGMSIYFNRQPTLHIGSMLERKVVIDEHDPWLTLRFNLSGTDSFNADMDGDEMTAWCATCLTECDTRVLTDSGFLFLDEIEARLARGRTVLYACYQKSRTPPVTSSDMLKGQLVYRPGQLVYPPPPLELIVFNSSPGEARRWAEDSDSYGADAAQNQREVSRHVSLRVTPNHKMYVQLGTEMRVNGKLVDAPPHKVNASTLLSDCDCPPEVTGCSHRTASMRMLACADMGCQPTVQQQQVVRTTVRDRLNLTELQWMAFLELFGFWLGDGFLSYRPSLVAFDQVKQTDVTFLRAALPAAGITEDDLKIRTSNHTRAGLAPFSRTRFSIRNEQWFNLLDQEYGCKYTASTHHDNAKAVAKQGNYGSVLESVALPTATSIEQCDCMHEEPSTGASSAIHALRCSMDLRNSRIQTSGALTAEQQANDTTSGIRSIRGRVYRGQSIWWLRDDTNNKWGRQCACGHREWTITKVGVNVRMQRHADVCTGERTDNNMTHTRDTIPTQQTSATQQSPDPTPPPTDHKPVKSVRWFPDWVLTSLTPDESRLVIRGLWRADGFWATQAKAISTSGVFFRDQLMQLLMHCGCSPYTCLMVRAGKIQGYQLTHPDQRIYTLSEFSRFTDAQKADCRPIRTTVDNWKVTWTDSNSVSGKGTCWPSMRRQQSVTTEPYSAERDGRIWCVTVQHEEHLIVAQRAKRYNGVVTKQSRPIIVGQSWASVAELVCCASTEAVVKTSEDGRLLQVLKQDALTGGYLLTTGFTHGKPLSRADFFQCCMMVPRWTLEWIECRLVAYTKEVLGINLTTGGKEEQEQTGKLGRLPDSAFTGHSLLSLLFPLSFSFDNPSLKLTIRRGLIHSGVFNKQVLSEHRGSMLHLYESLYGARAVIEWISAYQILVVDRLRLFGFSIGMKDTELVGDEVESLIEGSKRTSWIEAREAWVANDRMSEVRISTALNNIKALGERVTTQFLKSQERAGGSSNGIITGIASGAKGSFANVASMTVMVGQQNVEGRRIPMSFNGELGERTLPSYLGEQMYRERIDDGDVIFDRVLESRGRIVSPYRNGLTPQEYFFAAQAGREGMIDCAIKSVVYDTAIILYQPDRVLYTQIGEWIDTLVQAHPNDVQRWPAQTNMEYLELNEPYQISTMDLEGNVSWGTISAVTRHDPGEYLFVISTLSGRTVTVVDSESLLVWNGKSFEPRLTSAIHVGDSLPVSFNTPPPPQILTTYSVAHLFPKAPFTFGTAGIPVEIPLNGLWGRMVGVWLAGGADLAGGASVESCFVNLCAQSSKSVQIFDVAEPSLLATIFEHWAGQTSRTKHVPDIAFSGPDEFALGILSGYLSCESCIGATGLTSVTVSRRLSEGISALLMRFGVFSHCQTVASAGREPRYMLHVRAVWAERLKERLTMLTRIKAEQLRSMMPTAHTCPSTRDVVRDPIVSIQRIDAPHAKVYDMTVAGTFNFGLANGLQVRDTGRSGYLQRRLVKSREDVHIGTGSNMVNAHGEVVSFGQLDMWSPALIETVKIENQSQSLAVRSCVDMKRLFEQQVAQHESTLEERALTATVFPRLKSGVIA